MGTKRIGLARTQALLENLKRDLDVRTFKNLETREPAASEQGPHSTRESPQPVSFTFLYNSSSTGGGAAVELQLSGADGSSHNGLPVGFVATHGFVEVVTAPTSTGSATIAIGTAGTSNDPDGFFTASVVATLPVNKVIPFNGALITNAAMHGAQAATQGYRVVTTADPVTLSIGTAILTAGKMYIHIHGFMSKG